ncbi:MAG: hypothetical protein QOG43_1203 [Actinomycetota bacterium]|jgi:hypothetical protein|nr:hypothetical protein [Actinomycetota bacterium]
MILGKGAVMAEARTATVPDSQAYAAAAKPGTMGICLSGGGIRAAAFGLGALQSMQENGILTGPAKADYLAAVSGGSYIATAVNLVARGGLPGEPGGETAVAAADPFARGTPEEQFLREHTTYLVHGPGGRLVYAGRVVGGILLNILFLALLLHLIFRPAGWIYGGLFETLRRGYAGRQVSVHLPTLAWLVPLILVALGLFLGLVQIAVRWNSDTVRRQVVLWCARLLKVGIVAAVVVVGIPHLLELIRDVVARLGGAGGASTSEAQAAVRSTQRLGVATGGGLAGAVATALWALRARATSTSTVEGTGRWLAKKGRAFAIRFRVYLQNLLATIFGPLLLLSLAVFFVNLGAANTVAASTVRTAEIAWVVGLAVLLAALYYFADLVAWSIQPLYKRRLSASFALRRVRGPDQKLHAEPRPYSALYKLSESQPPHLPTFLICAAVNISDYGATATGSNVGGFVFGADEIGGPVTFPMPTTMYEAAVGRRARDFTLPAAMSISGAAISPSMGKMSRPPLRFLLALLNVRLGVWIPNPRRIWLANEIGDRYDRQLADDGKRQAFPINPRPSYLLREMFGRNHIDSRFIYVSDGGHYENLGLVELLRRGCTTIWCVDASGESIDSFGTIADAVAIARSELAVDIDIDPRVMAPDPKATGSAARFVRRTHVVCPIRYHDGTVGTLVLIKAGVPDDAPVDVLQAHRRWKSFPCDPTSNQLYTAQRFDAYRSLGYFSTARAFADPAAAGAWPGA